MKPRLAWILGALLFAAPAIAAEPDSSALFIAESAATPHEMRARLFEFARTHEAADPTGAGEAMFFAGRSFEIEGLADSAIAAYERAIQLRGSGEEHMAAVDALFRRVAAGDEQEALRLARATLAVNSDQSVGQPRYLMARIAWGQFLTGQTAAAMTQFGRLERSISTDLLWRLRLGRAYLETGNPQKAYLALLPVAVASRGRSLDAMSLLERSVDAMGLSNRFDEEMQYNIALRDRDEKTLVTALGGKRVRFAGPDSFPLGGTMIPAPGRGAHPGAVVLVVPGDTIATWDSVAVALRRAGISTMLLDLRGGGWSVERYCPLPVAWEGRRQELVDYSAEDVSAAFRALGAGTAVTADRYSVIASGGGARVALAAAEHDSRIVSVVLMSPRFEPVERGPARAQTARAKVPAYFVVTGSDIFSQAWYEPLFLASPPGASRESEVKGNGSGPDALRSDPEAMTRMIRWIKETKAPRPKASPPPGSRRRE